MASSTGDRLVRLDFKINSVKIIATDVKTSRFIRRIKFTYVLCRKKKICSQSRV